MPCTPITAAISNMGQVIYWKGTAPRQLGTHDLIARILADHPELAWVVEDMEGGGGGGSSGGERVVALRVHPQRGSRGGEAMALQVDHGDL